MSSNRMNTWSLSSPYMKSSRLTQTCIIALLLLSFVFFVAEATDCNEEEKPESLVTHHSATATINIFGPVFQLLQIIHITPSFVDSFNSDGAERWSVWFRFLLYKEFSRRIVRSIVAKSSRVGEA